MTDNKWKKMIGLVDTMGDWGGYQLYEWFKLFPEQRETALREYIYLKAHLIRGCMTALKKDLSKEEWNEFYLALGKQMEATPDTATEPPMMGWWKLSGATKARTWPSRKPSLPNGAPLTARYIPSSL